MTKTQKSPAPSLRERFNAAAEKVHQNMVEADEFGGVAADGAINGTRQNLELVAKFNEQSEEAEMLRVLKKADKKVETDPFARRVFIAERIKALAADEHVPMNGAMLAALVADALSVTMPDGTTPAIPVLEPAGKGSSERFAYPIVTNRDGYVRTTGTRSYASRIEGVVNALEALRTRALIYEYNDVTYFRLVNWKEFAGNLVGLIPGAMIVSSNNAEKRCAEASSWIRFDVSRNEILLIPATLDYATDVASRLGDMKETERQFRSGESDIITLMRMRMNGTDEHKLMPRNEFLKGHAGFAAVTHSAWKKTRGGDDTVVTNLLIERHLTFGWRIVLANMEATRALLRGNDLAFTSWNSDDVPIPSHIFANLRGGEDIDFNN